jgi:hypothetical protein
VRINIGSITLTGDATLGTCTSALPSSLAPATPLVLDPSAAGTASITCNVVKPAGGLSQSQFEAGSATWTVTVGSVVAQGTNNSANAAQTVSFTKSLTQTRKYQLGIKRVAAQAGDSLASVTAAGECQ